MKNLKANNKRPKWIDIIPLIIIASLFIGITAYSHYYGLTEIDLFSSNLSFENPDQEILLSGQKNQSKIMGSGLPALLQKGFLMKQFFNTPLLENLPETNNPTLRC
jgi:hypothetical protein